MSLRAVITDAVQSRLGGDADVTIEALRSDLPDGAIVDAAQPVAGARLGRSTRFELTRAGQRVGSAVATVRALVPHLRARQALRSGAAIDAADVEESFGDPGSQQIEALPRLADIAGTTASRSIAPGEVLTDRALRIPPAVRSGARVTVRATFGGIDARGVATALQSGRIGDVILVVNPDSRRQLRGRIVARGEVEVVHGS